MHLPNPKNVGGAAARTLPLLALACLLALPGCNVIDAMLGKNARLSKMVPGGNVSTGKLDCWLDIEIKSLPKGVDPSDLRVRFSSAALSRPAEFDWRFMADHDVLAQGEGFGSGYRQAEHTRPEDPPPVGETVKVRFPLEAKRRIDDAPSPLWLEVDLLWGGKLQDSERRSLEHVYSRTDKGFF